MKTHIAAALALILSTSAGLAGSFTEPPVDPVVPTPAPPAYNWTGAYAGVGIGYLRQRDRSPGASFVLSPTNGAQLSALIGYNWQGTGPLVVGGEAMIAGGRVRGSGLCSNTAFTCSSSVGTTAALRMRIGVAQDRTLFFMTAGLAHMSVTHRTERQPDPGLTSVTRSRGAWTVGLGVEHAMMNGWNIRGDVEAYRLRGGTYILDNNLNYSPRRGQATAARLTLVRRF